MVDIRLILSATQMYAIKFNFQQFMAIMSLFSETTEKERIKERCFPLE